MAYAHIGDFPPLGAGGYHPDDPYRPPPATQAAGDPLGGGGGGMSFSAIANGVNHGFRAHGGGLNGAGTGGGDDPSERHGESGGGGGGGGSAVVVDPADFAAFDDGYGARIAHAGGRLDYGARPGAGAGFSMAQPPPLYAKQPQPPQPQPPQPQQGQPSYRLMQPRAAFDGPYPSRDAPKGGAFDHAFNEGPIGGHVIRGGAGGAATPAVLRNAGATGGGARPHGYDGGPGGPSDPALGMDSHGGHDGALPDGPFPNALSKLSYALGFRGGARPGEDAGGVAPGFSGHVATPPWGAANPSPLHRDDPSAAAAAAANAAHAGAASTAAAAAAAASAAGASLRDLDQDLDLAIKNKDAWGLMGLVEVMRATDADAMLLSRGCDLTALGLNLNAPAPLYPELMTPFGNDPSLGAAPSFTTPPFYRMPRPLPPALSKLPLFSDETLFYIFYTLPRERLQEAAAQELYRRAWRFHKELKVWMTPDEQAPPVKGNGYERGMFICFDPTVWAKVRKEGTLYYDQLEQRKQMGGIASLFIDDDAAAATSATGAAPGGASDDAAAGGSTARAMDAGLADSDPLASS